MAEKQSPKEMKKADAEAEASKVKSKEELKALIVEEACLVTQGKRVDIQLLMAYCRELQRHASVSDKK